MKTYYLLGLCVTLALLNALRPDDYDDRPLELNVTGLVDQVHTPCCGDVNISLSGDDRMFHLDRALYQEMDIQKWKDDLEGEHIQLKGLEHSSVVNTQLLHVPVKVLVKCDKVMYSAQRRTMSL